MVFLRPQLLLVFLLLVFSASCTVQEWFTPGGEYASPDSTNLIPHSTPPASVQDTEEISPIDSEVGENNSEDLARRVEADLLAVPEMPPISIIQPEKNVVEPGMYASFHGHPNLSGELKLSGEEGLVLSGSFIAGRGSISIPDQAAPGLYIATVSGSEGAFAFGQIRVINEPSLWIETDRQYSSGDDVIEVQITSYGLPEYALAGIGLGRADWSSVLGEFLFPNLLYKDNDEREEYSLELFEETISSQPDQMISILIPTESGFLLPNMTQLTTLQDMTSQKLLLPGFLAEQIQVFAIDARKLPGADGAQVWVSDPVTIRSCTENGFVRVLLDRPGEVIFFSPSRGYLEVERAEADVPKEIELPPGYTAIYVAYDPAISPAASDITLVDVRCGEKILVEFEDRGEARSIQTFSTSSLSKKMISSTTEPTFNLAADPCKRFFVQMAGSSKGTDERRYANEHGLAAQIQKKLSLAGVHSMESFVSLLRLAEIQLQQGNQLAAQTILKDLQTAVEIDFVVQGALASFEEDMFLALSGINYKKELPVTFDSGWVPQSKYASEYGDILKPFIEKMADAAVCGRLIIPAAQIDAGESMQIGVRATNLAGEAVSGALIEARPPSLGIIQPASGTISDGEIMFQYQADLDAAGEESLHFDIFWEGSAGPVDRETAQSVLEIGSSYRLYGGSSAQPAFVPAAGLIQGFQFQIDAFSCNTGKNGPYEGSVSGGLEISSEESPSDRISPHSFTLPLSLEIPLSGESFQLPPPFHSLAGRYHPDLDIVLFSSLEIPLFYAYVAPLEGDDHCPVNE
jgi:hypothetical protein